MSLQDYNNYPVVQPQQNFWKSQVYANLLYYPFGTNAQFFAPYHPSVEGAVKSTGLNVGQIEDWRFPPDAFGQGLHVHLMPDGSWKAHIDKVHPSVDLIGHLREDAPQVYKAVTTVAGAAITKLLGGHPLAGALSGWLLGKLTERKKPK